MTTITTMIMMTVRGGGGNVIEMMIGVASMCSKMLMSLSAGENFRTYSTSS